LEYLDKEVHYVACGLGIQGGKRMGLFRWAFNPDEVLFRRGRLLLLVILFSGQASCSSVSLHDWQSPYGQEHPLAGTVWRVEGGQRMNIYLEELQYSDLHAPWMLIGEVHDNADHHRIQRKLIESQIRAGHYPALVFEQFDQEQQPLIDEYLGKDLTTLEMKSEFQARGWEWSYYKPLLELAVTYKLPVYAGNLSRQQLKQMRMAAPSKTLGKWLEPPLATEVLETLEEDILSSHCDMIDEDQAAQMASGQRLRDAGLAQTMTRARQPAVLIAGNGHVRRDYGVGGLLEQRQWRSVLSIGLIEVQPGKDRLEDYDGFYSQGERVFDIVMFTPRARDEDPCITFKKQLQEMGKKP
jgi:uncharacterized iron-regulated protein